jgi:hypothetical protein
VVTLLLLLSQGFGFVQRFRYGANHVKRLFWDIIIGAGQDLPEACDGCF